MKARFPLCKCICTFAFNRNTDSLRVEEQLRVELFVCNFRLNKNWKILYFNFFQDKIANKKFTWNCHKTINFFAKSFLPYPLLPSAYMYYFQLAPHKQRYKKFHYEKALESKCKIASCV